MKKYLSRGLGLALGLSLLLTGCTGGDEPKGSADVPAPTAAAPVTRQPGKTERPAETAKPAPTATAAPAPEAAWDDSLIGEYRSEDGIYRSPNGLYEMVYSYHVPRLEAATAPAEEINGALEQVFAALTDACMGEIAEGQEPTYRSILWESHWHGSLLSLVVETVDCAAQRTYEVWHYDFSTGEMLDGEDILDRLGIPLGDLLDAQRRAVCHAFDEHLRTLPADQLPYWLELRSDSLLLQDLMDDMDLYEDEDGVVHAASALYTLEGGGVDEQMFIPDLTGPHSPRQSSTLDFVTAELSDGGLTLTFTGTEEAGERLTGQVDFGVPYPVQGLYGNYKELFLGRMDNGDPYVCLLTEEGWVELCDVMQGVYCHGQFYGSGPILGIPEITGFESGTFTEADGSTIPTICALDAQGERWDLSDSLHSLGGAISTSLLESAWLDQDTGDLLTHTWEEGFRWEHPVEGGTAVTYVGGLSYLGLTENGLCYACFFTEDLGGAAGAPDYRGLLEIAPVYDPGSGQTYLGVTLLDGEGILGLYQGEYTEFVRCGL